MTRPILSCVDRKIFGCLSPFWRNLSAHWTLDILEFSGLPMMIWPIGWDSTSWKSEFSYKHRSLSKFVKSHQTPNCKLSFQRFFFPHRPETEISRASSCRKIRDLACSDPNLKTNLCCRIRTFFCRFFCHIIMGIPVNSKTLKIQYVRLY